MKINISKSYKDIIIFKNFEIELKDNLINVIIGPSGSGKTTLLRCIARLCEYEGRIESKVQSIGYVFQEDRLFPYLKVITNLLIVDKDIDKVETLLKQFNVYDLKDKYPHQLSGGEKQRISIIRAFLGEKELILMDEPFKSLDYHLKMNLVEMIYKIQKLTNKTIVLVTHDLDIALYLGDYIHVLSKKVTRLKETIFNPYVHQELDSQSVVLRNKLKHLIPFSNNELQE
ncbi:ABC transporter ATP-binding protein [Mycoplasmatota bacterium]|nr:ABC transporter ATP-binding protein [Mycoplasmatota bacterium]